MSYIIRIITVGLLSVGISAAAVVSLDFTGVATTTNSTTVGGFYNGGISGDNNTGTNFGVSFSNNTLVINDYNGCCEPDSASGTKGILFFTSGAEVTLTYAAGFSNGFSFYYSSLSGSSTINVFDGLNGTGTVLATLSLVGQATLSCPTGATGVYCNWTPIGVTFVGVAKSIDFGGVANFVAFDNITFGSDTPQTGVPEPSSVVMGFAGLSVIATLGRRKLKIARK